MNAGCRVEPTADKFTVFGPDDEDVAVDSTPKEAEQDIQWRLQEDAPERNGEDTCGNAAIKSYMDMFRLDCETARESISHDEIPSCS